MRLCRGEAINNEREITLSKASKVTVFKDMSSLKKTHNNNLLTAGPTCLTDLNVDVICYI